MSYWNHLCSVYILPFNAVGVFTTALSTEGVMLVRSDGMVPMRVVRCGVIHRHGRHLRHKGRCIVASLPVSGVKEDALHAHRLACFSMVCSLSSIFSPYPSVQSGFWAGGRLTRPHTHASTISESLDSSPAGFGLAGLRCWISCRPAALPRVGPERE